MSEKLRNLIEHIREKAIRARNSEDAMELYDCLGEIIEMINEELDEEEES